MRIKERWQICKCHRGDRTGLGVWTVLYEASHKHTCFSVSPSSSSSSSRRTALSSSLTEAPPHCSAQSEAELSAPFTAHYYTSAVLQKVTANHLCRSQGSAVNRDTLRAATSSSSSEACPCPASAFQYNMRHTSDRSYPEVSWSDEPPTVFYSSSS